MIPIVLNIIFCLAFLAFAYVNLNDIDAPLWVTIYMVAATCCGLAVFEKYYPIIYLIAIAFYMVYAIILFFAKDGVRDWIIKYKRLGNVETMQAENRISKKRANFLDCLSSALLWPLTFLPGNQGAGGLWNTRTRN